MHTMRCLLAALTLALLAPSLQAEIRFPSVIGDNMVLQRGEPVPVWGWDMPWRGRNSFLCCGPRGSYSYR